MIFLPFYIERNNCPHSNISSIEGEIFRYKRAEDKDVLEAYKLKTVIHRCKMCGKTNEEILETEAIRREDKDVSREDLVRYKAIIKLDWII